jgi:NADPH-dependent ferric siderophore reductase
MTTTAAQRSIQRVRHEVQRREVGVAGVERLGDSVVRVTFSDPSLTDFASDGFDDHIKFIFPDPHGEPVRRDYTPRAFDRSRGELVIEFALHGHGPAADWARRAAVGQRVMVAGPRGSRIVPKDYDWHLLAGDLTALPAIRRRLEELPSSARVFVFAQAASDADRQALIAASRADVWWVGDGDELVRVVRRFALPDGEGFVWCAGEASVMKRLRAILIDEKGHAPDAARIAAYWKQGSSDFHERIGA